MECILQRKQPLMEIEGLVVHKYEVCIEFMLYREYAAPLLMPLSPAAQHLNQIAIRQRDNEWRVEDNNLLINVNSGLLSIYNTLSTLLLLLYIYSI